MNFALLFFRPNIKRAHGRMGVRQALQQQQHYEQQERLKNGTDRTRTTVASSLPAYTGSALTNNRTVPVPQRQNNRVTISPADLPQNVLKV